MRTQVEILKEELENKKKEVGCEIARAKVGTTLNRNQMNGLWGEIVSVFGRKYPRPDAEDKPEFVNVTEWLDYLGVEYEFFSNNYFCDKIVIKKSEEDKSNLNIEGVDILNVDYSKMTSKEIGLIIKKAKEEVRNLEKRINEVIPNIKLAESKMQVAIVTEKRKEREEQIFNAITRIKNQLENDGADFVNSNGVYEITDGQKYFVGYIKRVNLLINNIETQLKKNSDVMNINNLSVQMLIDYKKLPWNEERARKMKNEIMNEYREQGKELVQFFSNKNK